MKVAEQIKRCRQKRGLTQQEVGRRLFVSRKTISGWETGHRYPDIDAIIKLSELFEVTTDELLKGGAVTK